MFLYSAAPPPPSTKTKLNLNKRVAFPLQSSSSPQQTTVTNVQTSSVGLPLPLSGSRVPPSDFNLPPTKPPTVGSLPPPPPLAASSGTYVIKPSVDNQTVAVVTDTEEVDTEKWRDFSWNIFQRFLSDITSDQQINVEEIRKRINLMNDAWLANSLPAPVQSILYQMAKGKRLKLQSFAILTKTFFPNFQHSTLRT